jgi:uncharacterized glyoxalase superfamily protein PhnB
MKLRSTTPVFLVSDIAATLAWYRANLQFEGRAVPERPPHTFGIMARDDVEIFLQQLAGYRKPDLYGDRDGGVWDVYVHVDDVRGLFAEVSGGGVPIVYPLTRQPYGQDEFAVRDPNGYVLVFAQAVQKEIR